MNRLTVAFLAVVVLLCVAFVVKQDTGIYISNTDGQVKFKAVDPTMATTGLPYIELGTQTGTVFQVTSAGAVVTYATTNQLVFGASNTAPSDTNLVLWISVQVQGDTNIYRLGLAK